MKSVKQLKDKSNVIVQWLLAIMSVSQQKVPSSWDILEEVCVNLPWTATQASEPVL